MQGGRLVQERYELKERLGRGGMAEVWLAHDSRLDRPVAIKFLDQRFGDDPEHLVRFFAEAQSVARIQHPNVATVLDFGEVDGHPFLVMYHVTGGSLADCIGEPMPPERALEIIAQIAAAAGAAHALGIVHRDIKPDNVLLDEAGDPRLADFGIASLSAGERLTASGTAMGSPHYISPEQALDAGSSPASDVYALGIVLFEMLTGRRPFEGDTVTAVVFAQVDQEPAPPSAFTPGLDASIDALVLRCLAKDPEERFENGTDLSEAVGVLLDEGSLELHAGASTRTTGSVEPVAASTAIQRRAWAALVVLPIILILTVAGFMLLTGSTTKSQSEPRTRQEISAKEKKKRPKSPGLEEASIGATPGSTPSPEVSDAAAENPGAGGNEGGGEDDGVEEPEPSPSPEPSPAPSPSAVPSPVETPSP